MEKVQVLRRENFSSLHKNNNSNVRFNDRFSQMILFPVEDITCTKPQRDAVSENLLEFYFLLRGSGLLNSTENNQKPLQCF